VRLPVSASDTVAGFVIERLGRLARIGDVVQLNDISLQVTAMDRRRISELLVVPRAETPSPPSQETSANITPS
jgi:putative hemolysin